MQLTDSFILQRSITNNNELILYKNGNNLGDYVPYDDKTEEKMATNEANELIENGDQVHPLIQTILLIQQKVQHIHNDKIRYRI